MLPPSAPIQRLFALHPHRVRTQTQHRESASSESYSAGSSEKGRSSKFRGDDMVQGGDDREGDSSPREGEEGEEDNEIGNGEAGTRAEETDLRNFGMGFKVKHRYLPIVSGLACPFSVLLDVSRSFY